MESPPQTSLAEARELLGAVIDAAANLPKLVTEKAPAGIFCAEVLDLSCKDSNSGHRISLHNCDMAFMLLIRYMRLF